LASLREIDRRAVPKLRDPERLVEPLSHSGDAADQLDEPLGFDANDLAVGVCIENR
jgi:hypothetical protein